MPDSHSLVSLVPMAHAVDLLVVGGPHSGVYSVDRSGHYHHGATYLYRTLRRSVRPWFRGAQELNAYEVEKRRRGWM